MVVKLRILADIERQVTELYDRIEELLKEFGIKWADLARLIGLSPKTLSSMRSQKVNPSWTTIRKIATVLDVSLDELTNDPYKTPELYDYTGPYQGRLRILTYKA